MEVTKIYSKEEAKALWIEDQISYAEKAHEYPCCSLPKTLSVYSVRK